MLIIGLGLTNGTVWTVWEIAAGKPELLGPLGDFAINSIWGAALASAVVIPIAYSRSHSGPSRTDSPRDDATGPTTAVARPRQWQRRPETRSWDLALFCLATLSIFAGSVVGLAIFRAALTRTSGGPGVDLASLATAPILFITIALGIWTRRTNRAWWYASFLAIAIGAVAIVLDLVVFGIALLAFGVR
jgi:hypothetical protein